MARHLFIALFRLLVLSIVAVNSHGNWFNRYPQVQMGYSLQPLQRRNSFPGKPGQIEFVQGTIDQLNQIDAQWVCTNQKTGDQMIIGTEKTNENTAENNGYSHQQNLQAANVNQWNGQQQVPQYNPHQQLPQYNHQHQLPQYDSQQQQLPQYNPQQQLQQYNPQQQVPQYNPQQQLPQYNPQQLPQNNLSPQQLLPNNPTQENSGFPTPSGLPEKNQALLSDSLQTTTEDTWKHKFDNFDWTSYVTIKPMTPKPVHYDGQGIIEPRVNN